MSKEDREVMDMANGVREDDTEAGKTKPVSKKKGNKICNSMPRWRHSEFRQMLSEAVGWTGFGGVVLACMLAGCCPMGVAVPVFIGCFAWVAILLDRFFRG